MKKPLLLGAIIMAVCPAWVSAGPIMPKFSLDPASPAVDGNITPDDVLEPGPVVFIQGNTLGLQDNFLAGVFDNLDALSFGRDPIRNPLFFSVDRVAVGLPGSAAFTEAQPGVEEAQGDVYRSLPPFSSNSLFIDEQALGLTPGFFGDDLDALELDFRVRHHTYFSIDSLSASNGFGAGTLANDIFIDVFPLLFASGEIHIGLNPDDDLDALVLFDKFQPGVLNPGIDKALFSLSTFSSSAFTLSGLSYAACTPGQLSPADVCFTDFTGSYSLWSPAGGLGLRADDELDALDTVPEPSTAVLLTLAFVGFVTHRRTFAVKH